MIKGARRQMIVIRTGDSRYFDEAYFVLRSDVSGHQANDSDILREANRILSESASDGRTRERRLWRWIFFGAGILCGALCATLAVLLLF
ncbi:MAG: hypothetical protein IJW49_00215 [Clostridia bacterium]|nr:hypothetical protein [Clostridia bacterium]